MKEKLNYKEILSKIKKLLIWWKQRDLTLVGKIQLLKTFIYSKLIYVGSLTPLPEWVYKELDLVVWEFIWQGKPKIKKTVLVLDYEHGGVKFMHFSSLIDAQRVMWVKRLFYGKQEMKWKQYFQFVTKHIGGKFIFCCNYFIYLLNLSIPEFYKDLLKTWVKTRDFRGNYNQIRKEVLFNNKMIRIEGKCSFDEKLFLKKCFRLEHIMDKNGKLFSVEYFYNKGFNYLNILSIQKIYEALPVGWKRNTENTVVEKNTNVDEMTFIRNGKEIPLEKITSKDIYVELVKKVSDDSSVIEKMRNLYFCDFSNRDIKCIFSRIRSSTLSSALRDFQYRLLHGIVYTNYQLFQFKFVNDNLCSFCHKEEETYKHIFYTCDFARKVWGKCSTFFEYVDLQQLSWEEIFFGIELPDKGKAQLVNHVIILVKKLLFLGRKNKTPPTEFFIKRSIEQDRLEEEKLAVIRNTLSIHLQKWENWKKN